MIKDNRNEIIETLRLQNEYWAEINHDLEENLLINRIYLIAISLYSLSATIWLLTALSN